MDYTLSKEERLKKGHFRDKRWQKTSETEHFVLLEDRNDRNIRRIGIGIRKKLGRAVVRNRIKRMVKEFYRLNKDLFTENMDHLIKIKGIPQNLTWKEIISELETLLKLKKNY